MGRRSTRPAWAGTWQHSVTEYTGLAAWDNNHGYYALGARAEREPYVLFSHRRTGLVVMAGRIDDIIDALGKPGKKIIAGEPLPEDHPVWKTYVGKDTPERSIVRNPVTYPKLTVPSRRTLSDYRAQAARPGAADATRGSCPRRTRSRGPVLPTCRRWRPSTTS